MTVCGTGIGNFPQPGDPDLSSPILVAQSGHGGIAVSWTYPNINGHAVAHTLLYRSTGSTFPGGMPYRTVSGNYYFDNTNVTIGTTYYYWIQMVSVHGTVGELLGPASAVMQPPLEQIIALLEGQVSSSQLAQDLKSEIDRITDVSSGLTDEVQARLFGENVLTQLISGIQSNLSAIDTLVASEIIERTEADSALVASVNLILAKANTNAAAIQTEQVVRANADSAIAASVTTLQATTGTHTASIQNLQTVVTGPGGLSAQWMVKTDVNGYVSGFGLYNTGFTSEFIIHADTFAIGKPGVADSYPFMIGTVNGQTVIALNASTLIPDGEITNLMIGNYIQSNNYNPTTGIGWRIDKSGWANFSAMTIRDTLGNVILSSNTGLEWSYVAGEGRPQNGATAGNSNQLVNVRFDVDTALWTTLITGNTTSEFEFGRNRAVGATRYYLPTEGSIYIRELSVTTKKAYWYGLGQPMACKAGDILEVSTYTAISGGVVSGVGLQFLTDEGGTVYTGVGVDGNSLLRVPQTCSNATLYTGIETLDKYQRLGAFLTVPASVTIKAARLFLIYESGPVDGYAYFTRPYLGFRSNGQSALSDFVGTWMKALSVDSLYIKDNAVTVPVGFTTTVVVGPVAVSSDGVADGLSHTSYTELTALACTFDMGQSATGKSSIQVALSVNNAGSAASFYFKVVRFKSGTPTEIWFDTNSMAGGYATQFTTLTIDSSPGAGVVTYKFYAAGANSSMTVRRGSSVVMGLKK